MDWMHTSKTLGNTTLGSLAIPFAPIVQGHQKPRRVMMVSAYISGYIQQSRSYLSAYPAPNPNNVLLASSWRTRSLLASLKSKNLQSSRACQPVPSAGEAHASATSAPGWAQTMQCGATVRLEANGCPYSLKSQISARKR